MNKTKLFNIFKSGKSKVNLAIISLFMLFSNNIAYANQAAKEAAQGAVLTITNGFDFILYIMYGIIGALAVFHLVKALMAYAKSISSDQGNKSDEANTHFTTAILYAIIPIIVAAFRHFMGTLN